jgi:23S rRNA pseudouridine1911/1915/1917 synthase
MPYMYSMINNKTTFLIVALLLQLLRNNVHVGIVVALASFHNTKSNYNYNYYQPSTLLVTTTHTRYTCSSSSSTTTTRWRLQVSRGIPTAAAAVVPIGGDDHYNNDDDYSDDTTITTLTPAETTAIGIIPSQEEEEGHYNNDPHHNIQHNNTSVNVVFEDGNYFFVSKPPGMICTGGDGRDSISFHEVVKAYGLQTYGYQPGLLHRLDKGTSGLMVYAKSLASAKHYLNLQNKKGAITKQYLAVVEGVPPYYPKKQQGRIEGGICKSIKDPTGPYIIAKGKHKSGKRVLTTYKVLRPVFFKKEDNDNDDHGLSTTTTTNTTTTTTTNPNTSTLFTLLSLRLFTGRKHQIRASCRKMKCPIVGDTMYGGPRHPVMLLHAHNIVFTGPEGNNNNDVPATEYNVTAATPSSWNEFGVQ